VKLSGLYLDEDTQSTALIEALRARGLSVLTTTEGRMSERTDEEQLRFAVSEGRVLVSCNVADFARLHSSWMASGQEHSGILLVPQQRWGPGEISRRIVRLLVAAEPHGLHNQLRFLSDS